MSERRASGRCTAWDNATAVGAAKVSSYTAEKNGACDGLEPSGWERWSVMIISIVCIVTAIRVDKGANGMGDGDVGF